MFNQNDRNKIDKVEDIDIFNIFRIIRKKKFSLILPVLSVLTVVTIYILITNPVYESTVILKKESTSGGKSSGDEFEKRFAYQSLDELGTEMEMIMTRTVLDKVISDLDLLISVVKIEHAQDEEEIIDLKLSEYNHKLNTKIKYKNYPKFSNISINQEFLGGSYHIRKSEDNIVQVFDSSTDELIYDAKYYPNIEIELPFMQFYLNWPSTKKESVIFIKVNNIEIALEDLRDKLTIFKEGKVNLLNISAKSKSPYMAQLIANTTAEKFREARLEQKRQIIHYSFNFIDNQLKDISLKLKQAEQELSQYKKDNQIVMLDESSRDLIRSSGQIEAEKRKTELELTQYRNELYEIEREVNEKGYIDQTYLTPGKDVSNERSPFSALLTQLSNAELQRLELLQKRKENHPEIIAINQQISQIKEKLTEYNKNTITSYKIIISTLEKKRQNLTRLMNKNNSELASLPEQASQLAELMRNQTVHEKMYTLLLGKREELRVAEYSKLQDIVVIDPAHIPFRPVAPKKRLLLVLGAFLGLIIAIIGVFIQEFFNKKISNIDVIEKRFSLPILAIFPNYDKDLINRINDVIDNEKPFVTLMDDQPAFRESYRLLRTRLNQLLSNDRNTLIVTSCEEDTGKTTVVANYALTLARANKKVLIIDCDLRKSAMAKYLKIPKDTQGLTHYLANNNGSHLVNASDIITPVVVKPKSEIESNLSIINLIPAGGIIEHSSEFLDSPRMKELIDIVSPLYDFVLIDTPPVTKIVDTLVLGNFVKDVVLLIRPDHTFKEVLQLGIESLTEANMNILGFIVNSGDVNQMSHRYKYGYGYGYGYENKDNVNS